MRNIHFKHVRESWKSDSTFVMGKNRVMSLALGRDEAEEYATKVSRKLKQILILKDICSEM